MRMMRIRRNALPGIGGIQTGVLRYMWPRQVDRRNALPGIGGIQTYRRLLVRLAQALTS